MRNGKRKNEIAYCFAYRLPFCKSIKQLEFDLVKSQYSINLTRSTKNQIIRTIYFRHKEKIISNVSNCYQSITDFQSNLTIISFNALYKHVTLSQLFSNIWRTSLCNTIPYHCTRTPKNDTFVQYFKVPKDYPLFSK